MTPGKLRISASAAASGATSYFNVSWLPTGAPANRPCQRVVGENAPVIHDDDAIAQPLNLFHVVRRIDHRSSLAGQHLDGLENGIAALRVDTHRRLIEQ